MADYQAPLSDMRFVMREVFQVDKMWSTTPALSEAVDLDTADAILDECAKIMQNTVYPLQRNADEQGVSFSDGKVTTPDGYKEAFQTLVEGGWVGLGGCAEYGGMGMPKTMTVQYEEMFCSADVSLSLYAGLTGGAALSLRSHASDALKDTYLPQMYSGNWTGSMCLTEPHSGTDLGIIRTKAVPQDDGSYAITGTKIFITAGEHDLSENIIHLVLAKLPDAPAGSKGISLFLVPKFLVNDDGSLGERNPATCGSTEHKMGIHGSATCVMNFDNAKGFLVGEVNKGLAAMFTMMNYERLGVGIQGLGLAEMSYQRAVEYARERLQGRAMTGAQQPEAVADPLLVHADVRRMLLNMRALNEGGRAFSTYVAMQLDLAKYSEDAETRNKAEALVALLTPVAKAFLSDTGLETCVNGQQVFGGHGYIREWGQEQLVRDCRIAQIYEGTNGVQALDLMGRKIAANRGQFLQLFGEEIGQFIADNQSEEMAEFVTPLAGAVKQLTELTHEVLTRAASNPNEIGAASVDYLHTLGYVAYAYMWAKMAKVALAANGDQSQEYYQAKLVTARYYFARLLPRIHSLVAAVKSGADPLYAMPDDAF